MLRSVAGARFHAIQITRGLSHELVAAAVMVCHTGDDDNRRLVYATTSEKLIHYSASVQIAGDSTDESRLIWMVDVLPNSIAPYVTAQMDLGIVAMKRTLED